eukprot:2509402-Amphidinium_carterae.1
MWVLSMYGCWWACMHDSWALCEIAPPGHDSVGGCLPVDMGFVLRVLAVWLQQAITLYLGTFQRRHGMFRLHSAGAGDDVQFSVRGCSQ